MRHFLDINNIETVELERILASAAYVKNKQKSGEGFKPLPGRQLAMIFEKPSTRTRASFEVGINQLGGSAIILNSENSQLGRGESISDTAKVLSRYVDIAMIRCFAHNTLLEFAKNADIPVINGLTDFSHPCQVMADIMTFIEHRGAIQGKTISWVGDGNNMVISWIHAAAKLGFTLNVATPEKYKPDAEVMAWAKQVGADVNWTKSPEEAVKNSDAVNADTWVSMGMQDEAERLRDFASYQVNEKLMQLAKKDAIFLHCLPAHRGEEVTAEVIDGKQSVVFDEAENRLHVQKAVMIWCLEK